MTIAKLVNVRDYTYKFYLWFADQGISQQHPS
jgi:hypothetical protein